MDRETETALKLLNENFPQYTWRYKTTSDSTNFTGGNIVVVFDHRDRVYLATVYDKKQLVVFLYSRYYHNPIEPVNEIVNRVKGYIETANRLIGELL